MLLTLLNIVLPVFAVAALGFAFGRRQARTPDMAFINHANVMVFCPALVFSALLDNPVDLARGWPLVAAGVLIIVVPGLLLALVRTPGVSRPAFLVPGMFRSTGNIAIPLMLFGLGVRLSQDRIEQLGLALRINVLYLLAGLLTLPVVLWLLPLTPEWARMVALSVMLPPAVLNYLLCEQYRVEPGTVASVVLLGNVLSVATIPLVVWATLSWI